MSYFRKKPVLVQAFKLGTDPMPDWFIDARIRNEVVTRDPGGCGILNGKTRNLVCADIKTLEGWMLAAEGDWIIRGVKDELYPCKPYIFALTYEEMLEQHRP